MTDNTHTPGFDTICLHGGHVTESNRAHLTPIYASSTYEFETAEQSMAVFKGEEKGYIYGRWGNPTITEAEERIAMLEAFGLKDDNGDPLQLKAILHASGMAAVSTALLGNVKVGERILTHQSLYGGTHEIIEKILPDFGITHTIVDFHDLGAVEAALKADKTIKLMHIETPANPTLQCVDIAALTNIARQHGIIVTVDNTFATPYLQQPFAYGVDYVVHSTTKFLNGHGTAIGGILVGKDVERMSKAITKTHRLLGGNSNAFDAFLLVNGLRTLSVRMDRHCANAERVARFLHDHPAVAKVNYLGLEDHPDHAICKRQMKHPGAMLSFELKGGFDAGVKFINGLKICLNAVSLGTCDTLISHPASTTHMGVSREQRLKFGISDGLIRMSVGIENVEDIIHDLEQAMQ
jgi:methionine-gamma-lyase